MPLCIMCVCRRVFLENSGTPLVSAAMLQLALVDFELRKAMLIIGKGDLLPLNPSQQIGIIRVHISLPFE